MLATVNRDWDTLGEKAYHKLMDLIKNPDPAFEQYFDPVFVPSESCGCVANKEASKFRLASIRSQYTKRSESTLMDIYFSDLRISSTAVKQESDFDEKIGWMFGRYGGDEFIAVGTIEDEDEDVEYLQTNLIKKMEKYIEGLSLSFVMSVSVGYCLIMPDDENNIDEYVEKADKSMYRQKQLAHERLRHNN